MDRFGVVVVAALLVVPVASAATAGQHGLSEADRHKVVCVPKRTDDGAIAGGEVCRTGAQWEAALSANKRQNTSANVTDRAQQGAYLARPNQQRYAPKPTSKPF